MNQIKPDAREQIRIEREEFRKVFEDVKNGNMDFEDFYYDFLDNIRNIAFSEGYVYCLDTVEEFITESEGDIDYVKFLIDRDRKRGMGFDV